MREIILDTETTGLDLDQGDRLVEIGCLELEDLLPTGKTFQTYLNPKTKMSLRAKEITGLEDSFLAKQPYFQEQVDGFLDFIGGDRLVIHNAPFDVGFINYELENCSRPILSMERITDTLLLARAKFPGRQNNLDALCRHFNIDNKNRSLHSALTDCKLLARVYLELKGGRQPDLIFQEDSSTTQKNLTTIPKDKTIRTNPTTISTNNTIQTDPNIHNREQTTHPANQETSQYPNKTSHKQDLQHTQHIKGAKIRKNPLENKSTKTPIMALGDKQTSQNQGSKNLIMRQLSEKDIKAHRLFLDDFQVSMLWDRQNIK